MAAPAGTKKLTFKNRRRKSILCFFIVVISVLVKADICQAVIVEDQWSWQDEPMLRWGVWFERFEDGPCSPGTLMSAYGPRIGSGGFLWSLSGLVIPEGCEPNQTQFGNWLKCTTERVGGTLELAQSDDMWGDAIVFSNVTATVTEWTNATTGRFKWGAISLCGTSDDGELSVVFEARLRSRIDWPGGRFGRVKKVRIAIAPEPSTILVFGLLATLCLPYGKFVNKVRDSNS